MSDLVTNILSSFDQHPKPNKKKIGLFFGSFNPIHIGHLIIANYMVNTTDLYEIWFVVSPHNPHKKKASLLADYHRLAIVKEAIDDNIRFKASNIEFSLSQPSYTVDTLAYLKEKYPEKIFSLIMGEDNLRSLHKWKNYEVILKNNPIYIYPRVFTIQEKERNKTKIDPETEKIRKHPNITFTNAPVMQISSSLIRQMIKEGKSVRYLLNESARKYIDEMNFYK
ncbi:MAG TPA: nicotinate-nucleotide adenylyltransferase [Crocinitomix sp.]|nr:nicotinate-nucleotide adenylyltransferase [Crocinitomix sp.]